MVVVKNKPLSKKFLEERGYCCNNGCINCPYKEIIMGKELNEDSGFKVSIKTLIAIGAAMATVIGMWFMLQADIQEAKELPPPLPPDVSRMEFDMKDKNIRLSIEHTEDAVNEIKEDLKRMEDKIDKLK
mgnify:CR=1 FL=1